MEWFLLAVAVVVVVYVVANKSNQTMPITECNEMIKKMDEVVTGRDHAIRLLLSLQASEALAWKRQLKLNNIAPLKLEYLVNDTRSLVKQFSIDTLPLFENDGDAESSANDIVAEALSSGEQARIQAAIRTCVTSKLTANEFDPDEDNDGFESRC